MASQWPRATTASTCSSSETVKGGHRFKIEGYSLQSGLGVGEHISSTRFTIGGHEWRIRYYPDGDGADEEECKDYVAVHLELCELTKVRVRVMYDFKLRNQATGQFSAFSPTFSSSAVFKAEGPSTCGTHKFIKKNDLKQYLWDDCLEIECEITVISESRLREVAVRSDNFDVQVPPSNLSDHLFEWYSLGQEVDFTFSVGAQTFRAHKLVLAMRSQVFKAEIYGQRDKRTNSIRIEGMDPTVFKALLRFIYTDELLDEHKNEEMAKNLFAAAHKYKMERLKLLCGNILSKGLTVQNVAATLVLAEKHQCAELKDACIRFTISSERTKDDVQLTEGYKELEETYPAVVLKMFKESENLRKNEFKAATTNQVSEERPVYDDHGGGAELHPLGPPKKSARWDAYRPPPKYD